MNYALISAGCCLAFGLVLAPGAWAQSPSSPFFDQPVWDQNGGPSIYNTYDNEIGAQPGLTLPKDKALGRDSFGVPRARSEERASPDGGYFDSTGKACSGKSSESKCN